MDGFGMNFGPNRTEEDLDFCRGYGGANTNESAGNDFFFDGVANPSRRTRPNVGAELRVESEDDDEDGDFMEPSYGGGKIVDEEEDNDKVPEMPTDFYMKVESFLNREPPKLRDVTNLKVKSKEKVRQDTNSERDRIHLPNIFAPRNETTAPTDHTTSQQQTVKNSSKVKSKLQATTQKKIRTEIDHSLLREAFAYTDRLLKEALLEESAAASASATGPHNDMSGGGHGAAAVSNGNLKRGERTKVSSFTAPAEQLYMDPRSGNPSVGVKKKGSNSHSISSNSSKGAVRKLRSKVQSETPLRSTAEEDIDFTVSTKERENNKLNPVNFDELIANFESGATIQKLRRELEQSKQSMKTSENFMRQLSQEYLNSKYK